MVAHPQISLTNDHILFETEQLVVVNKEAGWPVHATRDPSRPHLERAVETWFNAPVAAVHRLDVWTSGAVMLARTSDARRRLAGLFEVQSVTKGYEAVCLGRPHQRAGTLKHYLAKHRESGRDVMRSVRSGGKVALTDYSVIGVGELDGEELSLVRLHPRTGRTHQLRVQSADDGWPILGDQLYGPNVLSSQLSGQLLHAKALSFADPWTETAIAVEAQPPETFESYAGPLRTRH